MSEDPTTDLRAAIGEYFDALDQRLDWHLTNLVDSPAAAYESFRLVARHEIAEAELRQLRQDTPPIERDDPARAWQKRAEAQARQRVRLMGEWEELVKALKHCLKDVPTVRPELAEDADEYERSTMYGLGFDEGQFFLAESIRAVLAAVGEGPPQTMGEARRQIRSMIDEKADVLNALAKTEES